MIVMNQEKKKLYAVVYGFYLLLYYSYNSLTQFYTMGNIYTGQLVDSLF